MARPLQRIDTPEAFARAFAVSRETLDRLETYEVLLRKWQKAVNLVAPATLGEVWHRHFADSAQLAVLAGDEPQTWLDLGTGAGFPGMVIAILLANPQGSVIHLVESNARKCAFLRDVSRATGAAVEIHNTRIESLGRAGTVPRSGIVTARALAPLDRLLGQAAPFFGPESRGLFLKGRTAEEEIEVARERFSFAAVLHPSRTDRQGRIVEITALRERSRTDVGQA